MRPIALCLFALVALGAGVGCGGDSGPPLTAEEFAKQANAICKAGDTKLAEEGKDLLKDAKASPDDLAKFFLKQAIPNARTKLKGISKLNPPTEEKAKVKKMLAAGRKATDTVEDGLKKQGAAFLQAKGPDPFKDYNDQAKDLKLTDCAG
jgi:ABC-type glycerol-3-phosphate transport system substrate-binding protein